MRSLREVERFHFEEQVVLFLLVDHCGGYREVVGCANVYERLGKFSIGVAFVDQCDLVVSVENAVAEHSEDLADSYRAELVRFDGAESSHAGGPEYGDAAAQEFEDFFW